jgi:hypothetical protein
LVGYLFHICFLIRNYALYKYSHPKLPSKVRSGLDLGFLGIKDDFPNLNCVLPIKKKNHGRGKVGVKAPELSVEQKAFNKVLAKERIVVEHTNSRVKKFLIWGCEFRNRAKRYDGMTDIVSGLVNFRILCFNHLRKFRGKTESKGKSAKQNSA